MTNPLHWLATHDRGYVVARRAARTAIVMPALFAFCDKVLDNPQAATFAAFGSFSMLLLVDFGGPMRERLQAQAALALAGAVLVCVGTLASRNDWLAAISMALVAFCVLFAGVVSSVLASASTVAAARVHPARLAREPGVHDPRPAARLGPRLGRRAARDLVALARADAGPLRAPAVAACRALAARLRAEVAYMLGGDGAPSAEEHEQAIADADAAVGALHSGFLATPYRPTGLSTPARAVVRLVDELNWLNGVMQTRSLPSQRHGRHVDLRREDGRGRRARGRRRPARVAAREPGGAARGARQPAQRARGDGARRDHRAAGLARRLPRARGGADRRARLGARPELPRPGAELRGHAGRHATSSWPPPPSGAAGGSGVTGRQPAGIGGPLAAAQERAIAHFEPHSVWLHNSLRGAAGLGLAVLVANKTGVQHSFWVIFGTLSVLRSNALNTGQFIVRGILGTCIGFVIGAAVLEIIGTNTTVLWILLPFAVLFAGIAPAVISFTAGQAAFTITLLILFNLIQPAGWRLGIIRIEDVAIGFAVSLVVGLLFWPRGAASALRKALAEAYADSSRYLERAVDFGMRCCEAPRPTVAPPADEATRAAASSRRLDDAFRSYLAERGSKPVPLAEVTSLVTGAAALRLTADAVLDLWQRDAHQAEGDRETARNELLTTNAEVARWYDELATGLATGHAAPPPLADDDAADARFVEAVRHDILDGDGNANATAVRMIWTGDHLDAARRMQVALVEPARATTEQHPLWSRLVRAAAHP